MNDIIAIKNYILYLKTKCHLLISIHSNGSDLILKNNLISFSIHENPYCLYIKSCKAAHEHCINKQSKIIEKCNKGSFCGVCWAGVQEYVYPIKYNNNIIGFICVSGFACENQNEYLHSVSKKYGFPYKQLQSSYNSLKKTMPDKSFVDTLIYPLCDMFELAHIKAESYVKEKDSFIHKLIRYIKKNYTTDISSAMLCKEFGCSRANLSKKFNDEMKMSLRQYITLLRINTAKNLLLYTELEISDISLSVGFSEPNYFCIVFKKSLGITPSAYRKKEHKT